MRPTRTLTAILILTLLALTACTTPATQVAETPTATATPEPTATATVTPTPTITPTPTPAIPFEADFEVRVEIGEDGEPLYFAELDAGEGLRTYQVTPVTADGTLLVLTDEAGVSYIYHSGELTELVDGTYAVVDGQVIIVNEAGVEFASLGEGVEDFEIEEIRGVEHEGETRYVVEGVDANGKRVTYEYKPETGEIVKIVRDLYINGVKWDDEKLAMRFATTPEGQGKYMCSAEGGVNGECNEVLFGLVSAAVEQAQGLEIDSEVLIPAEALASMGVDIDITQVGMTETTSPRNRRVFVGIPYLLTYNLLGYQVDMLLLINPDTSNPFAQETILVALNDTTGHFDIDASFSTGGGGFEPPETMTRNELVEILRASLNNDTLAAIVVNPDFDSPADYSYGGAFPLD